MRNIAEKIDQANEIIQKNTRVDMNVEEMKFFFTLFEHYEVKHGRNDALFYLIDDVFRFGFAVGYKSGKNKRKK